MAHGLDLADEFGGFGTWDGDDDEEKNSSTGNIDSEAESSGEEEEGAEKLVGLRRRWAPAKGLVVELSAEALRMLSAETSKFFEGPGTVRHVSLDGCEVRVEWDAQPGVHVAYPTGYMNRYHLRIYAPLTAAGESAADAVVAKTKKPVRQPAASRPKRQARASQDELEEARRKREEEREKQRQLSTTLREKSNR